MFDLSRLKGSFVKYLSLLGINIKRNCVEEYAFFRNKAYSYCSQMAIDLAYKMALNK